MLLTKRPIEVLSVAFYSERRTPISLVVNRVLNDGQINSINNQPFTGDNTVNPTLLLDTNNSENHALIRSVLNSENTENEYDEGFSDSDSDDNEYVDEGDNKEENFIDDRQKCLVISRIFKALVEDETLRYLSLNDGKKK